MVGSNCNSCFSSTSSMYSPSSSLSLTSISSSPLSEKCFGVELRLLLGPALFGSGESGARMERCSMGLEEVTGWQMVATGAEVETTLGTVAGVVVVNKVGEDVTRGEEGMITWGTDATCCPRRPGKTRPWMEECWG